MKWKPPLFAAITFVAVFGLVEVVLWVAGVRPLIAERDPFAGFSRQVRVFELDRDAGVWRTPERASRRSFNDQRFAADKPDDGLRLFTIGGSSAYGFPWGAAEAFPDALGRALQRTHPDRTVESVNAAAMSYGSHRLRILAHELVRYEPDVLVIYSGHNEFVERSFYAGMLERPEALDSTRRLLSHSRLFSAVTRLLESEPDASDATDAPLGIDVRRERPRETADRERVEVVRQFAENLGAVIDLCEAHGVDVVLSTVPSNLSGWRPNASAYPDGIVPSARARLDEAVAAAEEAVRGNDPDRALARLDGVAQAGERHALWWFVRGSALAAREEFGEAHAAYVRARDLDAAPTRATTELNDAIRSLAEQRAVTFVDAVEVVERFAPDGLPGFNLFEDYVHPKPVTHLLIAEAMWLAMTDGRVPASTFWEAVGRPRPDASSLVDEPLGATGEQTPAKLFNLAVVLENQGHLEQAEEKYRACLDLHPGYFYARSNLARLLVRRGAYVEAEAEYRTVVETEPDHLRAVHGLGVTLRELGRREEALGYFERATGIDPSSASSWQLRGLTLLELDRLPEAAEAFGRAVDLEPAEADTRVYLGGTYLFLDRLDEAETAFAAALALDAGSVLARNGLGAVHFKRGDLDAAKRFYDESLALDPGNAQARRALDAIRRRRAG